MLRLATLPLCPGSYYCLCDRADKLTLEQELTVQVPHSILTLMDYKGNYWLSNSWMVKYQSMLCENPCIRLNPATLLLIDSGPL
jgi:hypothetical protein